MTESSPHQLTLLFEAAARPLTTAEARVVDQALAILHRSLHEPGDGMTSPQAVRQYLLLQLARLPHECFVVLFLDAQNRLLRAAEMFRGTLSQTSVYPREIVKEALACNAAAVIFSHNHPSGVAEPSRADELLTASLKSALALIDVRVLDHIVVAGKQTLSFAERGLI